MKPKIAFLDIETAPALGYVWGKYKQNVLDFEEDWFLMSYSVKWKDGRSETQTLYEQYGYKRNPQSDKELAKKLWKVFDEADIIVAHNGDNFDIKKVNTRMLFHGLPPPSPFRTVDTLKQARRHFAFISNRLDDLARTLGVGRKLPTRGKDTWIGCYRGDKRSWIELKKYNIHDVFLLMGVYNKMLPWMNNHPNLGVLMDKPDCCPRCGKQGRLHRRGTELLSGLSKRARYQCQECGGWSSGKLIKNNEIELR